MRLGERTAEALRSGWFLRDSQRAFSTVQRRQAWDQAVADRGGRLPLCERCGAEVSWRDYSVDHRTPWTAGGPTTLGNAALMHATCYSSKGRSVAT